MKIIIRLVLCMTIWPLMVAADTATNMQVQRYLNALGYDVGAIDGIIGKQSKKQLAKAFSDNAYTFDGMIDRNEINILQKIAQKNRTELPEYRIGISSRNLASIMPSGLARKMTVNDAAIKTKERAVFGEFFGRPAVALTVKRNDRGNPGDWDRGAQRLQIQEKPKTHEMRDGNLYWYKVSIYVPSYVGKRGYTVSPWDLKARENGRQKGPSFSLTITNGRFLIQSQTGKTVCGKDEAGRKQCTLEENYISEFPRAGLTNRWIDFVMQIDLRKGQEDFKLWADDRLVFAHQTDLSPWGEELGFKFGPYRHGMFRSEKPIQTETIFYSDIARAKNCEGLGVDCKDKVVVPDQNIVFGAKQTDHLKLFFNNKSQWDDVTRVICKARSRCSF